jgi:hypothetical protein
MKTKKDRGPLRNFRLIKDADDELVSQSNVTGRTMTKVLERLLLHAETKTLNPQRQQQAVLPARVAVDEAGALVMLNLEKQEPAAAKKAFLRFRRMYNIKTLPGGVYSVRAIERAST